MNAFDLACLVEDAGHEVVGTAMTCGAALARAVAEGPDVVLVDYGLPDGDGVEAARAIQARTGAGVVFVTGYQDADTLEHISTVRPRAVLFKPVDRDEIASALARDNLSPSERPM